MPIRVISFDVDGCLFHERYCTDLSSSRSLIDHNRPFLECINAENTSFSKVIGMIGSNRQSFELDKAACVTTELFTKGSCFLEIKSLCEHLDVEFDPFLLADIRSNLDSGTSFNRAIDKDYAGEHSTWLIDYSKLTIVFAQIHKMANAHPDEDIVFDFYDDRGNGCREKDEDVLEHLFNFFNKHPQLMPQNVTLQLHHYDGDKVTDYKPIQGIGPIDLNYQQTTLDMVSLATKGAIKDFPEESDPSIFYNVVACTDYVTPQDLAKMAKQRMEALKVFDELSSKIHELDESMKLLLAHKQQLMEQSSLLPPHIEYFSQCMQSIDAAKDDVRTLTASAQAGLLLFKKQPPSSDGPIALAATSASRAPGAI